MDFTNCLRVFASMQRPVALVILALVLWGVAFSLEPKETMPPHGQLFILAVLSISAYIAGYFISFIKLPPLMGMLLMGLLLRYVGFVKFEGQYLTLEGILRNIALVIILTRAGLGLDPTALRKLSIVIARLAVVPSLVEIITTGIVSHYLFNLTWIWSFLLGHQRNMVDKILEGPLAVIYGISFGLFWGILVGFLPTQQDEFVAPLRTVLIGAGGLLAMFGSNAIHYDGAGPLGCVVAAFNPVGSNFAVLWTFFQPILFGLIGAAIDLRVLKLLTVGLGAACLGAALFLRLVVSVLIASGANLDWKEKLFVAIAWFPKATVQAAIGPVALDLAKTEDDVKSANIVLVVAFLSILLTAPLGAILITLVGPKLLKKTEEIVENVPEQIIVTGSAEHLVVNDGEEQAVLPYVTETTPLTLGRCYCTFPGHSRSLDDIE
ncbi:Sodium/hydrogen exchanger 9B2 [Blattella germanica]|nr:Sodium/hydrogen exchanger 9B2 [Blattella germanica]